jgi:hypothetical protein
MALTEATNLNEAVNLLVPDSNIIHNIINEDALTEITIENGTIPSIRKVLADNMQWKSTIEDWTNGTFATDPLQLYLFNGVWYWAPSATIGTTIALGATPVGDNNWKIAPVMNNQTYTFDTIENIQLGKTINGLDITDHLYEGMSIKLTHEVRHGDFTARLAADYTAEIAIDTLMGIHVPITGTDYVAVRDCNTLTLPMFALVEHSPFVTQSGDDVSVVFKIAKLSKKKLYLSGGGKYRCSTSTYVWDNTFIDGDYSVSIFTDFTSSGQVPLLTDVSASSRYKNVTIKGFTIWRIGQHAEHGLSLDNIDGLDIDVTVKAIAHEEDTSDLSIVCGELGVSLPNITTGWVAAGGNCNIATMYPRNRKVTNARINITSRGGQDHGCQVGYIIDSCVNVLDELTCREALGIEPSSLATFDFTNAMIATDVITLAGHGLETGEALIYSNEGGTDGSVLIHGSTYFAVVLTEGTLSLAETRDKAFNGETLSGLDNSLPSETHLLWHVGMAINLKATITSSGGKSQSYFGSSYGGSIIVTNGSGGYMEGVVIEAPIVKDRNSLEGGYGVVLWGARCIVNDLVVTGATTTGVSANSAYSNAVSGVPMPTVSIEFTSDVVINSPTIYGFNVKGLDLVKGKVIVNNPTIASETGTVGIEISDSCFNSGSLVNNATIDVPNGTASIGVGFVNVVDKNDDYSKIRSVVGRGLSESMGRFSVIGNGTNYNFFKVGNAKTGENTTYSGKVIIHIRSSDYASSNQSTYELHIDKQYPSATPSVTTVASYGLTTGYGASYPSFTFSIVGDVLVGTGVSNVTASNTYYAEVMATGDLKVLTP